MANPGRLVALCSLAVLVALFVVGAVSHGVLRHAVQTLPLWGAIVLGFRKNPYAKWMAAPCLIFWLAMMTLIWLHLTGLAHVVSGHFSAVEIAMTLAVGAASLCGIVVVFRWRTAVRPLRATALVAAFAVLQILAIRISLLPAIAHR